MKKIYFILLMFCVFKISEIKAQQTVDSTVIKRAQNVYVELLGQGLLLTANYDTRFSNKRNGIGGRIGVGYIAGGGDNVATVPIGLNYLLGKGRSFFEIGLGVTYLSGKLKDDIFDEDFKSFVGTSSFSYRLQPVNSGFSFRGGLTPIFGSGYFYPFYGLSLGYTFSGK
ncbi:MAG: hypothetical protein EOP43_06625 [Sphingobacteriaceae bacterium]|nr:MAG: hypothetical protein EOP43_06625 [Sphingobacteriaceae bacterium]